MYVQIKSIYIKKCRSTNMTAIITVNLSSTIGHSNDDTSGRCGMNPRIDVDISGVYQHADTKENQKDVNNLKGAIGCSFVMEETREDEAERHASNRANKGNKFA